MLGLLHCIAPLRVGDPLLPIDVVGVPKSIAMTLTYPEFVTHLNINKMKELVRRGPLEWPGAKYVIREDGTRYDVCSVQKGVAKL